MASLTDILILRRVLPIEALDTADKEGDEASVRRLVDEGVVTELQFAAARAAQAEVAFVELADYSIDPLAIARVPAAVCRRYGVLPVAIVEGRLVVAMVDPRNVFALDDISAVAKMELTVVVAERSDLLTAIDRFHRADGELNDLTTVLEEESVQSAADESPRHPTTPPRSCGS